MAFYIWLLSLSKMSPRFIHVVACVSTSFLFVAEDDSIVWIDQTLVIYSSVDGQGYFNRKIVFILKE